LNRSTEAGSLIIFDVLLIGSRNPQFKQYGNLPILADETLSAAL